MGQIPSWWDAEILFASMDKLLFILTSWLLILLKALGQCPEIDTGRCIKNYNLINSTIKQFKVNVKVGEINVLNRSIQRLLFKYVLRHTV